MTKTRGQLPLPLPVRTAMGWQDFYVSPSNTLAVAQIEKWREWPSQKLILAGPKGAGKTHLAHIWAASAQATIINAQDLLSADIPVLATGQVCVEDVEQIAGQRPAEEALFHLHNLVLERGGALMLTATRPPAQWSLTLPDLTSRMMSAQVAPIDGPDDTLLAVLLAKLFADRQLAPVPEVITYLVRHMPRNYATAAQIVAALDAEALADKRPVSRPMAVRILSRIVPPGGDADSVTK